jgi:CheY-like chemotaxis protein
VFQVFEQGDVSTTRTHGGTGLGLAISKRIVELMRGEVWVESAADRGSTFHFTAMFGIAAAPPAQTGSSMEELEGVRVLVIDDNATNRSILDKTLQRWRMLPQLAESGLAGLASLDAAMDSGQPVRLILLDEQMPGMDGLEVIERIHATPRLAGIAIIVLTSSDQTSSIARCRQFGVASYLVKPIRPAELQVAIRKALGVSQPARTTPRVAVGSNPSERLRILVAEDNLVNQKVATSLVGKMGHEVVLAEDGNEVLAKWRAGKFDLIFMDLQMPHMDGFEATQRIRQEEAPGEHIPIVAMTAHAMSGDRERCLAAGMDGYVSKPVSRKLLDEAIAGVAVSRRNS